MASIILSGLNFLHSATTAAVAQAEETKQEETTSSSCFMGYVFIALTVALVSYRWFAGQPSPNSSYSLTDLGIEECRDGTFRLKDPSRMRSRDHQKMIGLVESMDPQRAKALFAVLEEENRQVNYAFYGRTTRGRLEAAVEIAPIKHRIQSIAQRDGFIWFYKKEENPLTACFGNFHEVPLTFDGHTYQCAEAAFQAQKFCDSPHRMRQFENLSGNDAWKLAKKLTENWNPAQKATWRKRNLQVMKEILSAKFQNLQLRQLLLATKNAYLVEHTPKKGRDAFYADDSDGSGQNHLGNLLMEVRAECGGTGSVHAPSKYWRDVCFLK